MAELFETHRQVLEVLKEHTDGLSTAQLVKECRKKSTLDISDDNGKMSKLVNHMRGKYKFITTCDTKHFITPTGLAALQNDSDVPVLIETPKQDVYQQKPDVIDQLMTQAHQLIDTPLWEGREYVSDDEKPIHIGSNFDITNAPFILDPTNSVEASFIEIVKVLRATEAVPEPVLIRNKALKTGMLKNLADMLHPRTAYILNEIAEDLGKLDELPQETTLDDLVNTGWRAVEA